jgi:hypothetical protein
MEAQERGRARRVLEQRRRALLHELDAVYRHIALAEKEGLRVERRQAVLAERRRRLR